MPLILTNLINYHGNCKGFWDSSAAGPFVIGHKQGWPGVHRCCGGAGLGGIVNHNVICEANCNEFHHLLSTKQPWFPLCWWFGSSWWNMNMLWSSVADSFVFSMFTETPPSPGAVLLDKQTVRFIKPDVPLLLRLQFCVVLDYQVCFSWWQQMLCY